MAHFTRAIGTDDPESDPVVGFEQEYRKTIGRIRWLEAELAKIGAADLAWGLTKVEKKTATEFSGTDKTYEARENALYTMLKWERTHLLAIEKIFTSTKLDVARIEVQRHTLELLDTAMTAALSKLGHDVLDPAVRRVVMEALLAVPQQKELPRAE